jgi:hypothetical protein
MPISIILGAGKRMRGPNSDGLKCNYFNTIKLILESRENNGEDLAVYGAAHLLFRCQPQMTAAWKRYANPHV